VGKVIFRQIAQGVKYLHDSRIVHRDIKIDNILGKSEGKIIPYVTILGEAEQHFKLADFSTVRQMKGMDELLYDCAGTIGYRSPEQQFSCSEGFSGFAADVWSLGVTLFAFLHCKLPFEADSEIEVDIKAKKENILFASHYSD